MLPSARWATVFPIFKKVAQMRLAQRTRVHRATYELPVVRAAPARQGTPRDRLCQQGVSLELVVLC